MNLVLGIVALVSYILASSIFFLFGIDTFRPDLLTIFVFYAARTRKTGEGMVMAAILALLFAPFHYTQGGLFILQAMVLFFFVKFSSKFLNLYNPIFVALYLFVVEFVMQYALWGMSDFFLEPSHPKASEIVVYPLRVAGTTALFAPWITALIVRLEKRFQSKQDGAILLK